MRKSLSLLALCTVLFTGCVTIKTTPTEAGSSTSTATGGGSPTSPSRTGYTIDDMLTFKFAGNPAEGVVQIGKEPWDSAKAVMDNFGINPDDGVWLAVCSNDASFADYYPRLKVVIKGDNGGTYEFFSEWYAYKIWAEDATLSTSERDKLLGYSVGLFERPTITQPNSTDGCGLMYGDFSTMDYEIEEGTISIVGVANDPDVEANLIKL